MLPQGTITFIYPGRQMRLRPIKCTNIWKYHNNYNLFLNQAVYQQSTGLVLSLLNSPQVIAGKSLVKGQYGGIWGKPLPAMLVSQIWMLVQILATPFLIQFPAYGLGKRRRGPEFLSFCTQVETWKKLLASHLLNPSWCSCLGSEPAAGRYIFSNRNKFKKLF